MQEKSAKKGGIFGWANDLRKKIKPRDQEGYQVDSKGNNDHHPPYPTAQGTSSDMTILSPGNNPFRDPPIALEGHSDLVLSVAFSPSDHLLASGSKDQTIQLWNAVSGANIATLNGNAGSVYPIAFSPNGATLASSSWDNTMKLWDVGSRAEIITLKEHSTLAASLKFSPDGALLASGSHDRSIRLWDLRSRTSISTLVGHTDTVESVAFSPDGKLLASGSRDYKIQLWDVASRANIATLSGHSMYVRSVAFSPSGKLLASGSADNTIRFWNAATGAHTTTLKGHSDWVTSIAFSASGKHLASGSHDTTIRIWDVTSESHISTLRDGLGRVESVAFSPTGTRLASGSWDPTIRVWGYSPEGPEYSQGAMFASDLGGLTQSTISSRPDPIPSPSISVPLNNDITGSVSLQDGMAIGYGGFGDLFLGTHNDYGKVAMKKPRRLLDEALIRRFLREVNLWCSVSHPHILPCLGMCKIGLDVYVVSPFIENGDLLSCMARGMDLNRSKLLFEVAEALTHLHHRGIVHGDVKAQNILLGDDGSALLCDFGMAKAFDTMVTSTESKGAGSLRWMPPELFLGEGRSMASDVYSLGITIAEVLSGRAPYHDILENVAVMFHVVSRDGRPPKEPSHSPEGRSYVTLWATAEKCWVKDPKDRPYMAQVLAMLFPLTREKA